MIYCDTSLLVSALTMDSGSTSAANWLAHPANRPLAISDWTITEFASALAMKQRQGVLTPDTRRAIETVWSDLRAGFEILAVVGHHFGQAASLVDSMPRGLRAGDALHLAIALDHHSALATLDRDMADAARHLGVDVYPQA